jgi:hypothetical protein
LWQKLGITVSAVPIAIFCNVMRVSGQGLLDHYVSTKLSESFAHQFVGMIMLVPAFFLILMVGYVLDKVFIEEVDESEPVLAPAAPVPSGPPVEIRKPIPAPAKAPFAAQPAVRSPQPAARPAPKVSAIPTRPTAIPAINKPLPRPNTGAAMGRRPPVVRPPTIGPSGKPMRLPPSAPPRKPSSGSNPASGAK